MEGSKKKKTAILYAYNGSQFNGSQVQNRHEGTRTVEEVLEKGLFESGCISQDNYGNLSKVKWSRASRTDKGVHALCTVAGLRMLWAPKPDNEIVDEINSHLPSDIRVITIKLVANKFNAKNNTDYREYEYIFPFKALFPDEEFSLDVVKRINEMTAKIQGTHSFHNYSRDIEINTPQAKRYVVKFEASSEPAVFEGKPYLKFTFIGQSFIYHQIRKMVGMIVSILLGKYNMEAIEESFKNPKFYVPLAPAEGLYLARVHYSKYNRKMSHRPLIITEEEEKKIKEFFTSHILPTMCAKDEVFRTWIDREFRGAEENTTNEENKEIESDCEENKSDS